MIKIQNRTGDHTLCRTCRRSVIIDDGTETLRIRCHALDRWINFTVKQCDSYDDASHPTLYDMKQVAWLLDPNKKAEIGFHQPGSEGWVALTKPRRRYPDYSVPGEDD